MRFPVLILFLILFPATVSSQVDEEIRVVFRDVRLHVTDKQGVPVLNLKPEDFILTEDGQPQEVTFFEEVDLGLERESSAPINPAAGHSPLTPATTFRGESNVVIILDSSNMRAEAFPEFQRVIKEFIRNSLGHEHLVKIVQIEDRLIHLSSFLKNKEMLIKAVEKARYKGEQIRQIRQLENFVSRAFSRYLDPGYDTEESQFLREDKLYELTETVRRKETIKRNYFLLFDQSMAHLAKVFDQMSGSKTVYLFTGGGFVHTGGLVTPTSDNSVRLGRNFNSANVTIYSFVHVPRKSVFEDRARTDRARLTDQPNPIRELGPLQLPADETILENTFDLIEAPFQASHQTGGVNKGVHRLSNIDQDFKEFNRRVGHYYRLGYTLESPDKKTKVKIKLTNRDKGWKLHYGGQFNPIKTYLEMDEKERTVAFESSLVYSGSFQTDLDCNWGYTGFKGLNKGETIPVYIELSTDHFPKKGYEVGFAALNDIRDLIDISKAVVLHKGKSKKYLFYDVLLPRALPKYLRFLIIDLDTGYKSLYEMPYERLPVNAKRFHISGMTLSRDNDAVILPVNHLRKDEDSTEVGLSLAAMRKQMDPFALGNRLFVPSWEQAFEPSKALHLFFQLKEAQSRAEEYNITYTLTRGKELVDCTLRMNELANPSKGTYNCRGILETDRLSPGLYELTIKVKRDKIGEKTTARHRFEIRHPG